MARRIIYLINPVSGTRKKSSLKELISRKTREQNIEFEILSTEKHGDYEFLQKKIERDSITDLVICGGDGTINSIVDSIKDRKVNIGIIPMGSGNGLAFAAKIPKQPTKALDIVFDGKSSWTDAFYINNHFSCMLCGIGFDALVAHEFAKQKRRGLQTYVKVSTINFFKAKPYLFDINIKDKSFQTEAFFISIANSNQFGNNFTIAPQASLGDGLLDIVIVKKMSKFKLPFSVISQVTGINGVQHPNEYTNQKNIIYLQTDSLTIRNLNNAPLHVDGDPRETQGEFKIQIIKNCFRLIQPVNELR